MSRQDELAQLIHDSYDIIREYEQTIQASDRPDERLRARRAVQAQWVHIARYLDEYRRVEGEALPPELAEIAAHWSGAPALPPDPAHMGAYLQIVLEQCGSAETRPYRQLSELRGAPACLSLLGDGRQPGVYVPLRFDLYPGRERNLVSGKHQVPEVEMERDLSQSDVGLADVLRTPGHLALIGAAGSGKSTVLRLIAAVLATRDRTLAGEWLGLQADPLPIPIFLALGDFEAACLGEPRRYRRDVDSLLRFLDGHVGRWYPGRLPDGFVSGLARSGRAWLLLDALDEVADFDHRIAVRQTIERLAGAAAPAVSAPGTRLLVTACVAAYEGANTRLC